ncbi:MAG: zinc-dependent peptidase [Planctomycetes bacterium]|nr:zinc-dependent peptidase [Planctomycetota bacterium]
MWKLLTEVLFKSSLRELSREERATLDGIPFLRRLDAEQKRRFVELARIFLNKVEVTGLGGIVPTVSERAWLAASCALLFAGRPDWPYPPVKRVFVSLKNFDERTMEPNERGGYAGVYFNRGEYGLGTVSVTRRMIAHSFEESQDGYHVGVHEFAHALDDDHGNFDGVPQFLPRELADAWLAALQRVKTAARELRSVLRDYAAKDEGETFAVAVECFFERPLELRAEAPKLYEMFAGLLKQDPARFDEAELQTVLDEKARALVAESAQVHALRSKPRSGKLVWKFSEHGMQRRLKYEFEPGKWSRAAAVNPHQMDDALAEVLDDEVPVDFELDGATPKRVRPRGKTFAFWPKDLVLLDEKLEKEFLLSTKPMRAEALAKAAASVRPLQPRFTTTLDGRRALVLCERAAAGEFERLAEGLCRRYGGKIVKRNDGPDARTWEIRIGDATLVLRKEPLSGVELVARGTKADEALRAIGAAMGAEGPA